jgi:23S rRNA pseudouridine2604 synthase
MTRPCRVERVNQQTFRIILTQGLNRQIRRMCSALGYQVRRLQRVRIMHIHLGQMGFGKWRNLTATGAGGFTSARNTAGLSPSVQRSPVR